MKFDLPKEQSSIIKVIGVGGGGSNAVNHMYKQGINGVDFVVCNTDQQALDISPVPIKVQLGSSLTDGRGAGSIPEVGKNSAIENIDDIRDFLENNTKMVFVTAGMGGGTGTGAAPVIAQAAREMGILTVGIVTMPFAFEGRKRKLQAEAGIEAIREQVDTLLVINNDKLREMFGNLSLADAFAQADNVLTNASKGIAEIITRTGYINVDFEDVKTVMNDSGVAIMGSGVAEGEGRAQKAVEAALASPLLNDNDITGARYVLLNITFGAKEILMDEISDITDYIREASGSTADVIWGYGQDETIGDGIGVTLIATGFAGQQEINAGIEKEPERKVVSLEEELPTTLTSPIATIETPSEKEEEPVAEINAVQEPEQKYEEPYLKNSEETTTELPKEETPLAESLGNTSEEETTINETTETFNKTTVYQLEEEEEEVSPELSTEEATSFTEEDNTVFDWNTEEKEEESQTSFEFSAEKGWSTNEPIAESDETTGLSQEQKEILNEEVETEEPYLVPSDETSEELAKDEFTPQVTSDFNLGSEDDIVEAQQKKANERMSKIKELSLKLRTPSGISDLENEPAYRRKQIDLDDVPHSSDSEVSKFTLSEEEDADGEKKTTIKTNNSFLHDNVD